MEQGEDLAAIQVETHKGISRTFLSLLSSLCACKSGKRWDALNVDIVENDLRPPIDGYGVTPAVVDLVKRCWIRDPTLRPTAADLVEELEHFAARMEPLTFAGGGKMTDKSAKQVRKVIGKFQVSSEARTNLNCKICQATHRDIVRTRLSLPPPPPHPRGTGDFVRSLWRIHGHGSQNGQFHSSKSGDLRGLRSGGNPLRGSVPLPLGSRSEGTSLTGRGQRSVRIRPQHRKKEGQMFQALLVDFEGNTHVESWLRKIRNPVVKSLAIM